MKSRLWVYSGDRPSNGAKELAASDGFLRLRDGRFHKIKPKDVIINWGVTAEGWHMPVKVVNESACVKDASNKLLTLQILSMDKFSGVVPWTTSQHHAQQWSDEGHTVVVRNKLTGHSGDGIVIVEKHQPVPLALLYTKYVFKVREFRVHVVGGQVIDTQQKIKDPTREVKTWKIRSHENGFMYVRNGIVPSEARAALAVNAVGALGLDFGAVDIIEDKQGDLYVLEVNTGPGLEGQTVELYANAFRKYANHGG